MEKQRNFRQHHRTVSNSKLVPITIRISAEERDHLEHIVKINRSSLSEYLRGKLNEAETATFIAQRLGQVETQVAALVDMVSDKHEVVSDSLIKTGHKIDDVTRRIESTEASVAQYTNMIQGSFEQLFEAFFKLQGFIELMVKAQGGRR